MNYRLTALTPLLVGDGRKLSPIDYMVWKDQVNVLDQWRIFRLLAKGPRLEGYLTQLKRAEKLEFASWGGFAQNYADRRLPFEHASIAKYWEQARGETLSIPTFATNTAGPFLPASAIRGALRTGLLFARWSESPPKIELQGDRLPRRPGEAAEEQALGASGTSAMRAVKLGDSGPVPLSAFKVYLLRVSTLIPRGPGRFELGWKQAPRGSVAGARPEDATPLFAEMAAPGTSFEGSWRENAYLAQPEIFRALRWRGPMTAARMFEAVNRYAARLLEIQKRYAEQAGLPLVRAGIEQLEQHLAALRENGSACLLSMGWGSGLLAKTGWLDTESDAEREVLRQVPLFSRAIQSGLPFPKTRRIVFLNNQPAALPGWAILEIG